MMINYASIAVLALLAVCGIVGFARGFIKTLASLFILTASLLIASFLVEPAGRFADQKLGVTKEVTSICEDFVSEHLPSGVTVADGSWLSSDYLEYVPGIRDLIAGKTSSWMAESDNWVKTACERMAKMIVRSVIFALLVIASQILLQVLFSFLDLVAKLPGIRVLNRLLGLAAGVVQGLVYVWVVMAVLALLYAFGIAENVVAMIQTQPVLAFLYRYNILLLILMRYL